MQGVLDAPVPADVGHHPVGRGVERADEEPPLDGRLPALRALALDHGGRAEVAPLRLVGVPSEVRRHPQPPRLQPPVPLFGRAGVSPRLPCGDVFEQGAHLLLHRALVALEGQDVVGAGLGDGPGDLPLAARRVGRDDRAPYREPPYEGGHRRDLARLLRHHGLADHRTRADGPRADHARRPAAGRAGAAEALAVDGDAVPGQTVPELLAEGRHAPPQRRGVQERQHPAERVVARDAPRKLQPVFAEPRQPRAAEVRHLVEAREVRRPGGDGDEDDFGQDVLPPPVDAEVRDAPGARQETREAREVRAGCIFA